MKRPLLIVLGLNAVVALVFAGATHSAELLEDVVEKTFPLTPSGTFTLSSIDGTVQIYGSTENEVKVVATKKAFSPERLNGIRIEMNSSPDAVNITTTAPPKPKWGLSDRSGTIDYVINVPQTASSVKVQVPNGDLTIHGVRGDIVSASLENGRAMLRNCFSTQTIRIGTGGLDLMFDWAERREFTADAQIRSGNMRVLLPSETSFRVHAIADKGHVSSDFTDMQKRKQGGASELDESIGDPPRCSFELRARDGNIRIGEVIW